MVRTSRSLAPRTAALWAVLAGAAPAAAASASPEAGAVCVAPAPAAGYSLQFDEGPELRASTGAALGVGGLAANVAHVVTVRRDGKAEDLFRFDFARFASRFLCLSFDPAAPAWTLREMKRSAGLCPCRAGAAPAPGLAGWPAVFPLYERGVDIYAQGRLAEAAASFEEVLQLEPQNASAQKALRRVRKELAAELRP